MSQGNKSAYYQALKSAGVPLDQHYREYSTDQLRAIAEQHGLSVDVPVETIPTRPDDLAEIREQISGLGEMIGQLAGIVAGQARTSAAPAPAPVAPVKVEPQIEQAAPLRPAARPPVLDPTQHAGVTLNTHGEDEPIRTDEHGNIWYQNEVQKSGFPKPRGRRVLRDVDPGTVEETIKVGDYTETFEIPGDPRHAKPIEIKVTLPSYQTGIYKAPGMPFKIHTYNGARGFDWDDVNRFYGGPDLVPDSVKRTYVSSDLCYDITTVIRAINDEYRERVLKKETVR